LAYPKTMCQDMTTVTEDNQNTKFKPGISPAEYRGQYFPSTDLVCYCNTNPVPDSLLSFYVFRLKDAQENKNFVSLS
jgi:hypothetical protein